jgi:hypothetical protein
MRELEPQIPSNIVTGIPGVIIYGTTATRDIVLNYFL